MKKKIVLKTLLGIGIGAIAGTLFYRHKKKTMKNEGCCGCCNGCTCDKDDCEEELLYYENDDGKILKSPFSILDKYKNKSMSKPEKLTLYFAATPKDTAESMCKDKCIFKLSPCNGRLVCDTDYKPSCYVGTILPNKELYLWTKANDKILYARPIGEMYMDQKREDRWYVDLEIIE